MMADLESKSPTEARLTTAANLADHSECLDDVLPALRNALEDPNEEVRELAEQAFYKLVQNLPASELGRYEDHFRANPTDQAALRIVLTIHLKYQMQSRSVRASRRRLVLDIIATTPRSRIAAPPLVSLSPQLDGDAYEEARLAWIRTVDSYVDDVRAVGNAAKFLALHSDALSERLLNQCKRLESHNPEWYWYLGIFYTQMTRVDSDYKAKALSEFEAGLQLCDGMPKWTDLTLAALARAAFEAGEFQKARFHAEELVSRGTQAGFPRTRRLALRRGGSIHQGNFLLGRLALREGDVEEAKRRLMLSITQVDSEPVIFFAPNGPNVSLARDLLTVREETEVTEYLLRCGSMWKAGEDRVAQWIAAIERGRMPDFGMNLFY